VREGKAKRRLIESQGKGLEDGRHSREPVDNAIMKPWKIKKGVEGRRTKKEILGIRHFSGRIFRLNSKPCRFYIEKVKGEDEKEGKELQVYSKDSAADLQSEVVLFHNTYKKKKAKGGFREKQ